MRTAARLFSWSLSARVPSRQPSTSTSAVEKTRASLCGGMSLSSAVRLKGSVLGIKYLCRLTLKRRGVRLKIMRDKILKYGKYSNPRTDPATGQQFDYSFDTIGNRLQTKAGGDQTGANLRIANYTNNLLNQITSRNVPPALDVIGLVIVTNNVTVNGQTPYRKGEYFRKQWGVTNTSLAVWQPITVSAPGHSSVTGNAYIAQTPESFTYDADGNT